MSPKYMAYRFRFGHCSGRRSLPLNHKRRRDRRRRRNRREIQLTIIKTTWTDAYAAGLAIRGVDEYSRIRGLRTSSPVPDSPVSISRAEGPVWAPERPLGTPLWQISAEERSAVVRARERSVSLDRHKSWNTAHGRVVLSGGKKSYAGTCQECRGNFGVERSAASSRKWPSVCDGCKKIRRRRQAAEAMRKARATRKALLLEYVTYR